MAGKCGKVSEETSRERERNGKNGKQVKKLSAPFPSSGDSSIDELAFLLEMYREYPINPVTDLWDRLDSVSLNLLISQTIEHRIPQEERDKELAVQKYNELKEESGLQESIAIGEQIVLVSDLLKFENAPG